MLRAAEYFRFGADASGCRSENGRRFENILKIHRRGDDGRRDAAVLGDAGKVIRIGRVAHPHAVHGRRHVTFPHDWCGRRAAFDWARRRRRRRRPRRRRPRLKSNQTTPKCPIAALFGIPQLIPDSNPDESGLIMQLNIIHFKYSELVAKRTCAE